MVLTLKALLLASTPTATGPALATAAIKLYSSPLLIWMLPEISAPTYLESKKQEDCCRTKKKREYSIENYNSRLSDLPFLCKDNHWMCPHHHCQEHIDKHSTCCHLDSHGYHKSLYPLKNNC